MKPSIKSLSLLLAAALLSACAGTGNLVQPEDKPKPVLPADYAAALESLKAEQWNKAENQLLAYAAANPQYAGPHVNLALLYKRTKRDDKAKAALQKALSINPNNAAAHNQIGIYAREAGDFDAAQAAYERAIAADKTYPNAYLNLAILLDNYRHNVKQAYKHYQQYAVLIGEDNVDKQTQGWIVDAKRRR